METGSTRKKKKREREKGLEEIFDSIMTEKFLKLMSHTQSQIQRAQGTPSKVSAQIYQTLLRFDMDVVLFACSLW
jgi:hypothetical protein